MLTGWVASGKSTAREMFQGLAVPCLDLDQVAKDIQADINSTAMLMIAEHFPAAINPDGTLNRSKMRTLVVSDPDANERLKAIMTPPVMNYVRRWKHAHRFATYVILESAIVDDISQYDATICVTAQPEIQERRLMKRNPDWTGKQVQGMRMLSQKMHRTTAEHAIMMDNSRSLNDLRTEVMDVHKFFLEEWEM